MAIKIGHASLDENGKATGGKPGDQTNKEVFTRNWYKGGWHTVLRPKNRTLAEKSAAAMEAACSNDKIGYDQGGRNTLYKQANLQNFDLSKITAACECDCSSLIHVCAIAGGANLTYGSNGFTTRNMVTKLMATGDYEKLTDSKYLTTDANLKRGDILVKSGHTVMVLENAAADTVSLEVPILELGSEGETVKAVQRMLYAMGYALGGKNPIDGKFGEKTDVAVRDYQSKNGLYADGIVGAKTWTKLLGV
jgi:murein L,D-transpeptidase YcbB/YkuD